MPVLFISQLYGRVELLLAMYSQMSTTTQLLSPIAVDSPAKARCPTPRRRQMVFVVGSSTEADGPRMRDVGAHFDEMYCVLCGEMTQAFTALTIQQLFIAWPAILHHWRVRGGRRVSVVGASSQFCDAHAVRIRSREKSPRTIRYASDKRSLDQHGQAREPLLDLLAQEHPVLTNTQARRRALLFLCSPFKASHMYWQASREIGASLDSRAELLRHLLGLRNATQFRELCGIRAATVCGGNAHIQSAYDQTHTLPANDVYLQQLSASVIRKRNRQEAMFIEDGFTLCIPSLAGYLHCSGSAWHLTFWTRRLWSDLHRLVIALRRRKRPFLDPVEVFHEILGA